MTNYQPMINLCYKIRCQHGYRLPDLLAQCHSHKDKYQQKIQNLFMENVNFKFEKKKKKKPYKLHLQDAMNIKAAFQL